MKVLIVTPSYSPVVGGSEVLARTLSIKLNELGIHTDVMTFNMDRKWNPIWCEKVERDGSFNVLKMPALNLNPFSIFPINPLYNSLRINVLPKPNFKKKFKEYDIIHFLSEADLAFPILSCTTQQPKIMHCVGVKGLYTQYRVSRSRFLRRLFARVFSRLADLYIVSSYDEVKDLSDLGVSKRRILIVPCGIDTQIFQPDETKKLDNLVLFIGRMDRMKGLHVLLKSLSYLSFRAQVVIIGPEWGPRYFKEISNMRDEINERGIHTVEYLGNMKRNDLVQWYQKGAVLVRPDLLGVSGGNTAMEALACGTPVIGTGNYVIKHNVNGIIVPPNNPKRLAEALSRLLVDKELRQKYGREGRRIMEKYFSLDFITPRFIKVYEKMLQKYC